MNYRSMLIVCILLLSACVSKQAYVQQSYSYPKSSEQANILFYLDSNIEKTIFAVDGKKLATGRRAKVYLDDREHTISATPEGYRSKEEFLQPPYRNGQSLSFTFMLGDRIQQEPPVATRNRPQSAPRKIVVSDVDNPRVVSGLKRRSSDYALVIGIEEYRQQLPTADFAGQDAKTFAEYLVNVMGYPEENVITLINERAAKSDFEKYIEKWLFNKVDENSTVMIYYSGHGAPNPQNGDAYLVPYDGDPAFIDQTGYSLKRMYGHLARLKSKRVIVTLDACFSGSGGKSVVAPGMRALVRKEKLDTSGLIIMSASDDSQSSSTYDEKGHGMFTYFMLKKISEAAENRQAGLEVGELYDYLKPMVEKTARREKNNEQTPQLVLQDASARKARLF